MTFKSGTVAFLGNGNLLTNEGLISPGAFLRVLTINEIGNFLQTAIDTYGLDLEFLNQTSDRAGEIRLRPPNTAVSEKPNCWSFGAANAPLTKAPPGHIGGAYFLMRGCPTRPIASKSSGRSLKPRCMPAGFRAFFIVILTGLVLGALVVLVERARPAVIGEARWSELPRAI